MEAEALNYFALLNDGVARLPVTQSLQVTLDSEFERQRDDFFRGHPDEVPFDPGHEADQSYLTFIKVTRKGGKEAVVFPADKRALKELLRFLEQNYYASSLTGDKFISNSKRPLNA